MSSRIFNTTSLFVVLFLAPAAAAEDWPMFGRDRSCNAVSLEKDPPLWWQIPQADPKIPAKNTKWQASLGGRSKGDPIVANGLVWVGTNNEGGYEQRPAARSQGER